MKKEFRFRGKSLGELENMSIKEFSELLTSRARRSLNHGLSEQHKKVMEKVKKKDKNIKTHCRNMIILPQMANSTISVYNGKTYVRIDILPDMIGHYLGEFAPTRSKVSHHAPGIGATRSSASLSVK